MEPNVYILFCLGPTPMAVLWRFEEPEKEPAVISRSVSALLFEEGGGVSGRSREESPTLHRFSLLASAGTSRPLVLHLPNAVTL